jgi:hypothetical protein
MTHSQNNLSRTPRRSRKTLKLLLTIEQPSGWTIPMVQTMIRNGISHEMRSEAANNPALPEAIRILEAVRISLKESTTTYAAGGLDD